MEKLSECRKFYLVETPTFLPNVESAPPTEKKDRVGNFYLLPKSFYIVTHRIIMKI